MRMALPTPAILIALVFRQHLDIIVRCILDISCFHHLIGKVGHPVAELVPQNLAALGPADVMFDFYPQAEYRPIDELLGRRQSAVAWLLLRLNKRDALWSRALKVRVLKQFAA